MIPRSEAVVAANVSLSLLISMNFNLFLSYLYSLIPVLYADKKPPSAA